MRLRAGEGEKEAVKKNKLVEEEKLASQSEDASAEREGESEEMLPQRLVVLACLCGRGKYFAISMA